MARNTRRAAELFHMWRHGDSDDILALVHEAEDAGEDLLNIVCGLLYVGENLAKAAAHGEMDEYLEQLRGAAMVAEAMSGGSGD